jgi:hypothetical protein
VRDLLQRLANQAMGIAPKVHAAGRMRAGGPVAATAHDDVALGLPTAFDLLSSEMPEAKHSVRLKSPGAVRNSDNRTDMHGGEIRETPDTGGSDVMSHVREAPAETSAQPGLQAPQPLLPAMCAPVPAQTDIVRPSVADRRPRTQPEEIAPRRLDMASERQTPNQNGNEPTEVHVHIGRIEVTAAPAATPPKRAARGPARKSLSLEDYLAQRQRRAP